MPQRLFEVEHLRVAVDEEDAVVPVDRPTPMTDFGEDLPPGWVEVIPGMSFGVNEGEVLGLVGESASGKSLALLGAFGLLPAGTRVVGGTTSFRGYTLRPGGVPPAARATRREKRQRKRRGLPGTVGAEYEDDTWKHIVGTEIGFLFQDPIASWTPDIGIGAQAGEALEAHTDLTTEEITERVNEALGEVHLPKSRKMFTAFRHELSRGQAQRAMLAAALIKAPRLLIADEPFSGLDVSTAAAVLALIRDMLHKRNMAMIIIAHDLATVAAVSDRVAVIYGGRIVEEGPVDDLFYRPKHPYTEGLLGSIPGITTERLRPIRGEAPRITQLPRGCPFHTRCEYMEPACALDEPTLEPIAFSRAACRRKFQLELRGLPGGT